MRISEKLEVKVIVQRNGSQSKGENSRHAHSPLLEKCKRKMVHNYTILLVLSLQSETAGCSDSRQQSHINYFLEGSQSHLL